jgi:hypothetical protein
MVLPNEVQVHPADPGTEMRALTPPITPNMLDAPGLLSIRTDCYSQNFEQSKSPHPPFSQIAHGSLLLSPAFATRDPFSRSAAQKNKVLFGAPGRSTGMLPAHVRPMGNETLGNVAVTS